MLQKDPTAGANHMSTKKPLTINKQNQGVPFFEQAQDALLTKIAELNGVLTKHRSENGSPESLAFYEGILKIMGLASMYMQDTRYIHRRNVILESNIKYLAALNQELQAELDEIKTISKIRLEDRMDEAFHLSDKYVESVLAFRRNSCS